MKASVIPIQVNFQDILNDLLAIDRNQSNVIMPAIELARSVGSTLHHLVSGSYTNQTLFLLAFDTVARTLLLNSTIPGFGLHQFVTSNAAKDRVYATAMSEPPRLFSWAVDENFEFTHIDTINISKSFLITRGSIL
jgi:carboxy-cis,cis-muconate cyclase